jgi:endonuclease/exonuclease/phosphatase family metal-dependent hydrolase
VSPEMIKAMHLPDDFCLSRGILRAQVKLPLIGSCLVYVLHLKSKRPIITESFCQQSLDETTDLISPDISWEDKIQQSMTRQVIGGWASTIQRGSEAACLYYDIMSHRHNKESSNLPIIVLGDFNQNLASSELQFLVDNHQLWSIDNTQTDALPHEAKILFDHFALHDSHQLVLGNAELLKSHSSDFSEPQTNLLPRQPTHYFSNKGNVLDYILLSNDFNSCYQHSILSVIDHQTFNQHLLNPIFEYDSQASDHAMVATTIKIW